MLQITARLPFSAKLFSPPPKKPSMGEREYLRSSEVKAMIRAAKKVGRHGVRDGGIILLMFRHGLRTAELVALHLDADRFSFATRYQLLLKPRLLCQRKQLEIFSLLNYRQSC